MWLLGRAARWTGRKITSLPRPTAIPFTYGYVIALLAVAVIFEHVSPAVAQRAMAWTSTDAQNLRHHPILALITSAFWLPSPLTWLWALVLAAVLATLERRVGTLGTIAIFASGHVVATLITELPVVWAVHAKLLPPTDGRWLDIGVSYGLFTVIGALLVMLPRRLRGWVLSAIVAGILGMYLRSDPSTLGDVVTVAGHLTSVLIGMFGWRPWLRRLGLVGSLSLRLPRKDSRPPLSR